MSQDSWDAPYRFDPALILSKAYYDSSDLAVVSTPGKGARKAVHDETTVKRSRKYAVGLGNELLPGCVSFNKRVTPQLEAFLDEHPEIAADRHVRKRMYLTARDFVRLESRSVDLSRENHDYDYCDRRFRLFLEPAGRNRARKGKKVTQPTQDILCGVASDGSDEEGANGENVAESDSASDHGSDTEDDEDDMKDPEVVEEWGNLADDAYEEREAQAQEKEAETWDEDRDSKRIAVAIYEAIQEAKRIFNSKERQEADARDIEDLCKYGVDGDTLQIGERTKYERHRIHRKCGALCKRLNVSLTHDSLVRDKEPSPMLIRATRLRRPLSVDVAAGVQRYTDENSDALLERMMQQHERAVAGL